MKSNIFLSYYHEDKEYSDKFQELFQNEKCEVLKPYFVTENIKINQKNT